MGRSGKDEAGLASAIVEAAQSSSVGLIVSRAHRGQSELVLVNRTAERILGRTHEDLAKDPAAMLRAIPELVSLRRNPRPTALETIAHAPDGAERPIEVLLGVVDEGEGHWAEVIFLFDVSERKRAEARLRASTARFRDLLDAAPDAIALGTRERLLYVNPALSRLVGARSPADVIKRPITDFVHREDRKKVLGAIDEILETGAAKSDMHLRMLGQDGEIVPVELSAVQIDWMGHRATLAAGRDLRERRRVRARAARADRLSAIGTLTAGIAHEVNNPLAYVLLNLQYLLKQIQRFDRSESMTAKLIERVGEAQHGARRVRGIVADLRNLSRRDDRSIGPVSLESAMRAAVRIASSTFRDRAELVELYQTVAPVDANATKLEQVFVNLLVNAGQAIDPASTRPNAITLRLFEEGGRVVATITDTGTGIPSEVLGRVFDPFFTTKPRGTGTGLGLPISYQIVSSFGGDLTVESRRGRGTTFRVSLPMSRSVRLAEPHTPTPPPMHVGTSRARVLVIDDEPLVTEMVGRVFGDRHDVVVTTSPTEGLSLALSESFDVVFCDLLMPGMSGMDLYEEVARRRPGYERRLVFMTGGAFTDRASDFLARVDNRRIVKPFEIADLERALLQVAKRRPA